MNVSKPNQRATVYTLLERKTSQREIARLTGIDRKTVRSYHKRWLAEQSNSPGVATDPAVQTTPPWPPASTLGKSPGASLYEPYRAFIGAQLRLGRNATAIYQDLVDGHGLPGATVYAQKLEVGEQAAIEIRGILPVAWQHVNLFGEL